GGNHHHHFSHCIICLCTQNPTIFSCLRSCFADFLTTPTPPLIVSMLGWANNKLLLAPSRLCRLSALAVVRNRHSVGVIGVPFWKGQPKPGTDRAPDKLRQFGLLDLLQLIQPNVIDF